MTIVVVDDATLVELIFLFALIVPFEPLFCFSDVKPSIHIPLEKKDNNDLRYHAWKKINVRDEFFSLLHIASGKYLTGKNSVV